MKSHPDLNVLLDHIENHPEELLIWIENNVEFSELVKRAQQTGNLTQPRKAWWRQVAHLGQKLFLPDLGSLHGNAYVDDTLRKDVRNKAMLIAVANIVTIIPALPLLVITLSGTPLSALLSIPLAGFSLFGMNKMAERVITEWTRETQKRWVNLVGTGLLQASLTLVAGIGTTLVLDGPSLREQWAVTQTEAVITDRYQAGQEQVELLAAAAANHRALCNQLTSAMDGLPAGNVRRNDLFRETLGLYKDINLDRSQIPTEQLKGECQIADGYRRDVINLQQQLLRDKTAAEELIRSNGTLSYLHQSAPHTYALHFSEDGHLLSGTLKAQLATDVFFLKLRQGQLGALLMPLFVLSLSTIPSAVMILKLATFRNRVDVVRSFDPEIALLRDELFHRAQLGLLKALATLPEVDSVPFDSQLLE